MNFWDALLVAMLLPTLMAVGAGVLVYLLEHGQVHTVNRFCTRLCRTPEGEQ